MPAKPKSSAALASLVHCDASVNASDIQKSMAAPPRSRVYSFTTLGGMRHFSAVTMALR